MLEGRAIFFSDHAIKRYEQRIKKKFSKSAQAHIRDHIRAGKELSAKAMRRLGIHRKEDGEIYIKSDDIIYIVAPTEKQDGFLFITCWKLANNYNGVY